MRIALGIEYDGTNYFGWQRQPNVPTIQAELEVALTKVAAHPIVTTCAGRTDAGVHALAQVVHFDTTANRPDRAWILGTNSYLPPDIRVLWVKHVADDFSARYSAVARTYRYHIYNNKIASAILRHRTMWLSYALDEKLMQQGAQHLLGEHDFSSFRGAGCQSHSSKRNVMALDVTRSGANVIITIRANAFLLHMVRNIVGLLVKIGSGEKPPEWAHDVLLQCDRTVSAATAPAQGLYLVGVDYER